MGLKERKMDLNSEEDLHMMLHDMDKSFSSMISIFFAKTYGIEDGEKRRKAREKIAELAFEINNLSEKAENTGEFMIILLTAAGGLTRALIEAQHRVMEKTVDEGLNKFIDELFGSSFPKPKLRRHH